MVNHYVLEQFKKLLTLFMSSDRTSLGWAVLESRVTSTALKRDVKNFILFSSGHVCNPTTLYVSIILLSLNSVCVNVTYMHTPVLSSSLQKNRNPSLKQKGLSDIHTFISLTRLRWNAHMTLCSTPHVFSSLRQDGLYLDVCYQQMLR